MQCKSLWIKASAKCINVNVNQKQFRIRHPPFTSSLFVNAINKDVAVGMNVTRKMAQVRNWFSRNYPAGKFLELRGAKESCGDQMKVNDPFKV